MKTYRKCVRSYYNWRRVCRATLLYEYVFAVLQCTVLNFGQDPAVGQTYRGTTCQLLSRECGGGLFCLNSGSCEKLYNSDSYQCPLGTRCVFV